nr:hypothetical protein [Fredinandcohnia onubensis]
MIELRAALKLLLKTFHSRVHHQSAPAGTAFPYVVYNMPNSYTNEQQEIFVLDVDVWDDKDDTTELETIANKIWKGLNYHRHLDDDIQFSIYQENRLPPLDDDDPTLKRRKLIFQLKYFDRRLFE